jgi:putative methionine-R-sulfoxide reductase with GAF domain
MRDGPDRDRLSEIRSVTDVTLGRLDVDDMLVELLDRVCSILQADTAAVLLLDDSGRSLVARAARGIEEEVRQGVRIPVGVGFAGRIAATRKPVMIDRVDETTVANPILWEKGIRAMAGVPLITGGRLLGVLHVGTLDGRRFSSHDSNLLELVAERVANAVRDRTVALENVAARILQRSLLPSAFPACPGLEFASRYVPAQRGGVGGDWYDVFLLPGGDLWLMTGDVAGHGFRSAVIMGRLRSVLRAYADEGHKPEHVIHLASRELQDFEPNETATAICAVLSPPYAEVKIASAGHPAPVLASPDQPSRLIDVAVSPPLGLPGRVTEPTHLALNSGDLLLLYTDGLVERRSEQSLVEGMERLRNAVFPGEPDVVCRTVMDSLVGMTIPEDDIVVLATRRAIGPAANQDARQ